jgi:SPP1 family phage portal protein
MEQATIDKLIGTPKELIKKIKTQKPALDLAMVKLFDIKEHEVMNYAIRKKKRKVRGVLDSGGNEVLDEAGIAKTEIYYEEVVRTPQPIQKFIVDSRVNILLTNPVEHKATPMNDTEKNLLAAFQKTWEDNKLDYELRGLFRKQMSELEVAAICYTEEVKPDYWQGTPMQGAKTKVRVKVVGSQLGQTLYPVFNAVEDLIAFGYYYKKTDDDTNKQVEHFDIHTADFIYYFQLTGGQWVEAKPAAETMGGKLQVVYFQQDRVEWYDVQPTINRLEFLASNHGETNDYNAWPIALFRGLVKSLPQKDDSGKAVELEGENSMAEYMTWEQAIASVELEYKKHETAIMMYTGTLDMTMERMANLGTYSGVALYNLYTPAHLKAAEKESTFGKGVQRLINLLKAMLCAMKPQLKSAQNMPIKPQFNYYIPPNVTEHLQNLKLAKDAGFISGETAAMQAGLVEDGAAEWEKIQQEKAQAAADALKQAQQMPAANPNDKLKVV